MPWNVSTAMSIRAELVARYRLGESMTTLAAAYGVSRKTAYKWVQRADSPTGLHDQSRRPHRSPLRTPADLEARVLEIRTDHPTWGGRKIHQRLLTLGIAPPAPSTITDILHRHGLVTPATSPHQWTRFEASLPNDLWQLDFKGWHPLRQGRVHPLTMLDDHSRFLLTTTCLPNERAGPVRSVLTDVFRRYGLPWAILCDNGSPWGISTPATITQLGIWCIQLDIRLLHGRPYHPQTQGKLERLHRTLKAEVFAHHTYPDLASAQAACDTFRDAYNRIRPHQALDYVTPLDRYRQSSRVFPESVPDPEYADDVLVRRVSSRGTIRYQGRTLAVGEGLSGQMVGLRATPTDGELEVLFYHQVIRVISLHAPSTDP